jgi:hypothetical protein
MLAFLEALYRQRAAIPFTSSSTRPTCGRRRSRKGAEPKLQALMEQIVRRGRIKGFIPWLITQRPAVLSKDVLSQVDGLVAFKLTASQDRDALGAWIEGQADRAAGQGNPRLAADAAARAGRRVGARARRPRNGPVPAQAHVRQLADAEPRRARRDARTEAARSRKPEGSLARVEEEQKANDPKALKARSQRLTRELAKAEKREGRGSRHRQGRSKRTSALEARRMQELSTLLADVAPHIRALESLASEFSVHCDGKQPRRRSGQTDAA